MRLHSFTCIVYSDTMPSLGTIHIWQCMYCEVERVVKSLANNKAPGTDKTPSHVIKESAPVIIPLITYCKQFIQLWCFP